MPFRDPATGKTFNTIRDAVENFRCPGPCADCPLGQKVGGINVCVNGKWFDDHPIEAARLMGYEVIDDKEVNMDKMVKWQAGDKAVIVGNSNYHKFKIGETVELLRISGNYVWKCANDKRDMWLVREKDMRPLTDKEREGLGPSPMRETEGPVVDVGAGSKPDRPRLAELLGVEVGEMFRIDGCGDYWITDFGWLRSCTYEDDGSKSFTALSIAINHPELIIRLPRLTEPEIERCRVYGAKWVSRDTYCDDGSVDLWREKPTYDNGMYDTTTGVIASVYDAELFPSVKPGDCIGVEEIENAERR